MGISSPDILDKSIRCAKDLLSMLQRDRSDIDRKIADVQEHLEHLEEQKCNGDGLPVVQPAGRRRKGENQRAVLALFDASPDAALTKQEIAEKTGLPFSSVQAVLEKPDIGLSQEGGLWRRKKPGQ